MVLLWCGVFAGLTATAATLLVRSDSPSPTLPYTNWVTAAHAIQHAVDAAQTGDTVLVAKGVYATGGRADSSGMVNRVAVTKPLIVRSLNGPEVTIIEGPVRCVYLTNGVRLIGFTLTNGTAFEGGGVWCESTNAMISNFSDTNAVAAPPAFYRVGVTTP